jgi:hypothetical protein
VSIAQQAKKAKLDCGIDPQKAPCKGYIAAM